MLAKGFYKISISKVEEKRMQRNKSVMTKTDPEKYPDIESISYNEVIIWMNDKLRESGIVR